MIQFALIAHLVSTAAMTGLIWFIQLVHYPLLAEVGDDNFIGYENSHVRRTTLIVAPLMTGEIITTVALLFAGFDGPSQIIVIACVAFLGINWLSTALLQVPCHRKLEAGFDEVIHRRLVNTNWLRTLSWSAKCVLAGVLLV